MNSPFNQSDLERLAPAFAFIARLRAISVDPSYFEAEMWSALGLYIALAPERVQRIRECSPISTAILFARRAYDIIKKCDVEDLDDVAVTDPPPHNVSDLRAWLADYAERYALDLSEAIDILDRSTQEPNPRLYEWVSSLPAKRQLQAAHIFAKTPRKEYERLGIGSRRSHRATRQTLLTILQSAV